MSAGRTVDTRRNRQSPVLLEIELAEKKGRKNEVIVEMSEMCLRASVTVLGFTFSFELVGWRRWVFSLVFHHCKPVNLQYSQW